LANKKGLDFSFELAGDGRDRRKLQDLVKTLNLEQKIHFLGNLPLKSMPELYDKADVLLVSLKSGSHFSKTIPGKLQSYMAARKPVLGMISGEGKSVIEESNCGFVSEAGDIKVFINHLFSFVRLTQSQMNRLGLNGYEYYKNNFDREKLINDFIHHLSELHAARCS
jgi:colanic acid biosynthesis glycosyl transferase WcaI